MYHDVKMLIAISFLNACLALGMQPLLSFQSDDSELSEKWDRLNKINADLIRKKYPSSEGFVPLVRELDPSLCKICGSPTLFKLFAAAATSAYLHEFRVGEKTFLNLDDLREACVLFPDAVTAEHVWAKGRYSVYPAIFDTRISLLNFASHLYVEQDEQTFPLEAIVILLENGASAGIPQPTKSHVEHILPDFQESSSLLELFDAQLKRELSSAMKIISTEIFPDNQAEIIRFIEGKVAEKMTEKTTNQKVQ